MILARPLALAALALTLAGALTAAHGHAQQEGTVRASIRMGTPGLPVPEGVEAQLIVLAAGGGLTTIDGRMEGADARFEVVPDAQSSYLVRVVYAGVQYLSTPLLLSPDLPDADVEITIFEPTDERPALTLDSSVATVLALDRAAAQLTLVREDIVRNPSDRVYVGDDQGVTLRLPLPDGVVEAGGTGPEGDYRVDGQTIVTTIPLRPGANQIVTRYVVSYDPADNAYALRLTAPLPTERMEIAVPARFIEALEPLAGAERVDDRTLEGETLSVVALPGLAAPGDSAVASLRGLAGRTRVNPLTDRPGVVLAALLAVAIVAGGALALVRARTAGPAA